MTSIYHSALPHDHEHFTIWANRTISQDCSSPKSYYLHVRVKRKPFTSMFLHRRCSKTLLLKISMNGEQCYLSQLCFHLCCLLLAVSMPVATGKPSKWHLHWYSHKPVASWCCKDIKLLCYKFYPCVLHPVAYEVQIHINIRKRVCGYLYVFVLCYTLL
jgi:hypothetical protein